MPNAENINRLIVLLRGLKPRQFDMNTFGTILEDSEGDGYTECGTVACICGWANFLRITEDEGKPVGYLSSQKLADMDAATEWLGIAQVEARNLFLGTSNATAKMAIIGLETLRDTGTFSWADKSLYYGED